jgi:hypothetical protein
LLRLSGLEEGVAFEFESDEIELEIEEDDDAQTDG